MTIIQIALSETLKGIDFNNAQISVRSDCTDTEISGYRTGKRPIKLEKALIFVKRIGKTHAFLENLQKHCKVFTDSVKVNNLFSNQISLF